jgi:glycosyltransferase involved in cell wall biosynthesis
MKRVLILVENLPSPFDRRVWQEAGALRDAGYGVSIICPTGRGCEKKFEAIEGIYLIEYSAALFWTFLLSIRVLFGKGFDAVHACNPPDLFFLIGGFYKLLGKKFVFDHHDANPELYIAKFGRKDFLYRVMLWLERLTFRFADVSIATNLSYRRIAVERGGMPPERVFVVRSGPSLERLKIVPAVPELKQGKAGSTWWAMWASWAGRKASTTCCRPSATSFST